MILFRFYVSLLSAIFLLSFYPSVFAIVKKEDIIDFIATKLILAENDNLNENIYRKSVLESKQEDEDSVVGRHNQLADSISIKMNAEAFNHVDSRLEEIVGEALDGAATRNLIFDENVLAKNIYDVKKKRFPKWGLLIEGDDRHGLQEKRQKATPSFHTAGKEKTNNRFLPYLTPLHALQASSHEEDEEAVKAREQERFFTAKQLVRGDRRKMLGKSKS